MVDSISPPTNLPQERRNFTHLVWDIAWFGVAMPATSRFLSVYAIRLGADAMVLGWLTALPAILALLSSAFAANWRRRFPSTVKAQVWPGLGFRLMFLLPALTPFFPADWQPLWLILAVSIPALPQGISAVIFLVLMREGVTGTRLTALLSRRMMAFNIAVLIGTLGFGFWLEEVTFPINYQIMFVVAFGVSLISLWNVGQVRSVKLETLPDTTQPREHFWQLPGFQSLAFILVMNYVAFFAIIPIIPLRLVDELGADEAFMSIFAVFELISAALIAMLTNRIIERIGTRLTIALGMIGTGLAAIILGLTSDLYVTLIAAALSGGTWTMAAIGLFAYFNEATPEDNLTRYSTLYNQIVSLSVFVGPMLGSKLADTSLSLTTVLLMGAGLRLLVGVLTPYDLFGRPKRSKRSVPVT